MRKIFDKSIRRLFVFSISIARILKSFLNLYILEKIRKELRFIAYRGRAGKGSRRLFRRTAQTVKAVNVRPMLMRGGIRM